MSRGIQRERQVRRLLEDQGYWTARAAGSLGEVDVVALRAHRMDAGPYAGGPFDSCDALMVEVKSTGGGPYERFGPAARAELVAAAAKAGAEALLCWWPKHGTPHWIAPSEWPAVKT